jgi:hypothetical protein
LNGLSGSIDVSACLFSFIILLEPIIITAPPAQKRLRDLKSRISAQSKKNFVLERDVRYLDSRIALLIQNRMGGEEVSLIFSGIRQ